ncbi:hypothetical protein Esi_0026_0047 [Ectocarpus siliculosus]|uniref:Uncharacterized protein n=1 Tax=Ectocarpus siliculosus TaxID=2880 RepID=D8LJJ5_ECTSI|nr:hypothetical protein Esi_0026_0047 [Ectocarpus siliculosus]|eukprot:CBN77022.1 hypothetical protein Esi_0026_0047 [Ectocarpus siliculosus]
MVPAAESYSVHDDVLRNAVATAAAVAAAVANGGGGGGGGRGGDASTPNPTDLLSMLSSVMTPNQSTGARAFTEMVAASVGAGIAAGRGARKGALGASTTAVPMTRDTSTSTGRGSSPAVAVSELPRPGSFHLSRSGATNHDSVFEELALVSPLKKVKSFHFPLGSSRSLAVSAAASSTTSSTRGSDNGSDGGQEGGDRSGGRGRGGARLGAQDRERWGRQ